MQKDSSTKSAKVYGRGFATSAWRRYGRRVGKNPTPVLRDIYTCMDVDGVLADFAAGLVQFARDKYGTVIPLPAYRWDWWTDYTPVDLISEIAKVPDFYVGLPKMPLTLQDEIAVRMLAAMGKFVFTTSRFPTAGRPVRLQTQEWLRNNFQLRDPKVVHVTEHKHVPHLFYIKAYLIDTAYDAGMLAENGAYGVCLLPRPYNVWTDWLSMNSVQPVDSVADFWHYCHSPANFQTLKSLLWRRSKRPWTVLDAESAMDRLVV